MKVPPQTLLPDGIPVAQVMGTMNTAAGFTYMRRPRANSTAALAIVEVGIAMGWVLIVLAGVFAMNGQLLGLLRSGKQSTYATQLIAERMEQMRTCSFESLTDPGGVSGLLAARS